MVDSFLRQQTKKMESLWNLFHQIYDVETVVRVGGLMAITIIVLTETGLLVGFFLPGDSLLVTGGIFAAKGDLDLPQDLHPRRLAFLSSQAPHHRQGVLRPVRRFYHLHSAFHSHHQDFRAGRGGRGKDALQPVRRLQCVRGNILGANHDPRRLLPWKSHSEHP